MLEDRQRIAADLHDIVIQRLFAAGMFLQGGASMTADLETRHRLDTAVESMDAAIKDLRASIFELGGRRELPTDITTAIDDICVESARVLGFMPDLIVDDPNYVADQVRDDILAVLREALANVARHAQARSVCVIVRSDESTISLSVTDDGIGMSGNGRASGTSNMLARAREHGGDCTWTPVEPHGTAVHWSLPVAAVARPDRRGGCVPWRHDRHRGRTDVRPRGRFAGLRARARSTRAGRIAWRIGVTVAGVAVIAVGIVLLPLPGPGWLIIFAGLGLLGTEYTWAARLLAWAREQVRRFDALGRGAHRCGCGSCSPLASLALLAALVLAGLFLSL